MNILPFIKSNHGVFIEVTGGRSLLFRKFLNGIPFTCDPIDRNNRKRGGLTHLYLLEMNNPEALELKKKHHDSISAFS